MSRPYTYSMLSRSIDRMEQSIQSQPDNIEIQIINTIYSISCNIIPIVLLTAPNPEDNQIVIE